MSNAGGGNQFGNYTLQPSYGDVTKLTRLTRAAPMSGAPRVAGALNVPRQAQRKAVKSRSRAAANQGGAQSPVAPPAPSVAATWEQIARIPGITPLAAGYAQDALAVR